MEGWERWRYYAVYGGALMAVLPWIIYFLPLIMKKFQRATDADNKNQNRQSIVAPSPKELVKKSKPEPEKLEYIVLSPKELRDRVRGLTEIRREKISKPYIGKKLQVKIKVINVYENASLELTIFGEADDETSVFADFDNKWRDKVFGLNKGQQIIVDGKLEGLGGAVNLCNCKIMKEGLVADL